MREKLMPPHAPGEKEPPDALDSCAKFAVALAKVGQR
jgi:hypothetical protein